MTDPVRKAGQATVAVVVVVVLVVLYLGWLSSRVLGFNHTICAGQNELRSELTASVKRAIPRTRETFKSIIPTVSPEQKQVLLEQQAKAEKGFRESLRAYRPIEC